MTRDRRPCRNLSHAELLGYLRHRLSDADAAADLLHDAFLKAMRQGLDFCALDNPRAWLFRVARNALIDRARSARPADPLPDDVHDLRAADDRLPGAVRPGRNRRGPCAAAGTGLT